MTHQAMCLHHFPSHLCLWTKYNAEVRDSRLNLLQFGLLTPMSINPHWLNLGVFFLLVKINSMILSQLSSDSLKCFPNAVLCESTVSLECKTLPPPLPRLLLGLFLFASHFPVLALLNFPVTYLWFPVF